MRCGNESVNQKGNNLVEYIPRFFEKMVKRKLSYVPLLLMLLAKYAVKKRSLLQLKRKKCLTVLIEIVKILCPGIWKKQLQGYSVMYLMLVSQVSIIAVDREVVVIVLYHYFHLKIDNSEWNLAQGNIRDGCQYTNTHIFGEETCRLTHSLGVIQYLCLVGVLRELHDRLECLLKWSKKFWQVRTCLDLELIIPGLFKVFCFQLSVLDFTVMKKMILL